MLKIDENDNLIVSLVKQYVSARHQKNAAPASRAVSEDEALLRISVTYLHGEALLDRLADALMKCAELE